MNPKRTCARRLCHVKGFHMSWSGRGPDGRRGYHHGNLREALIQAALDLIAAQRLCCRPRSPASPRSCVLLLSRDRVLLPREPIGLETYCHRAQSGGQSRLHRGNASNVGFNRPLRPRLGAAQGQWGWFDSLPGVRILHRRSAFPGLPVRRANRLVEAIRHCIRL